MGRSELGNNGMHEKQVRGENRVLQCQDLTQRGQSGVEGEKCIPIVKSIPKSGRMEGNGKIYFK